MKRWLIPVLGIFPGCVFAQPMKDAVVQEQANKIVIEEGGIYPVAKDSLDSIELDTPSKAVLNVYPDEERSFWYKIYVAADSRITFEIYPTGSGNRYNYFLYRQQGDLDIREVYEDNILPVRSNLCTDVKKGTGLSLASRVSTNDSCVRNAGDVFYHSPYHSPVTAKAGEVLLLNVYHLTGKDCGYQFVLRNDKYVQEFRCVYESCYKKEDVVKKEGHPFKPGPLFVRKALPAKALFIVKDSARQCTMEAEVSCICHGKEYNTALRSREKGSYELSFERDQEYRITFSAFGYHDKTLNFSTKDSFSSFTREIALPLVRVGEEFVMNKIYFYPNTYAMRPGSYSQIDQLADYLSANPGINIEIQGHTNGDKRIRRFYTAPEEVPMNEGRFRGSARKLSQYRAELIKKYLVKKGIAPERLAANGYGGSKMIYPHPKDQEEANKNIRVGVMILATGEIGSPIGKISK